jgi:4-hydroxyphenylpyruvate dioxygenase-like putative hemolysin
MNIGHRLLILADSLRELYHKTGKGKRHQRVGLARTGDVNNVVRVNVQSQVHILRGKHGEETAIAVSESAPLVTRNAMFAE